MVQKHERTKQITMMHEIVNAQGVLRNIQTSKQAYTALSVNVCDKYAHNMKTLASPRTIHNFNQQIHRYGYKKLYQSGEGMCYTSSVQDRI